MVKRPLFPLWRALAPALCAALATGPARAEGPTTPAASAVDEARERYAKGVRLYEEGAYGASLVEFRRAYELVPNYSILYNIGQVNYQLQNFVEASRYLEKYLREGGRSVPAARSDEVRRELGELAGRIGTVEVRANVAGADVTVDDEGVGRTPLEAPVKVNAGRRRVSVAKTGYLPATAVLDVVGGEAAVARLELAPVAPPAASPPAPSGVPDGGKRMTTWSWAGLGLAGAFAVGAGVTGLVAYGQSSDVKDRLRDAPAGAGVDDDRSQARTLAVTTDVLAGAAVLTAGATLVLTFILRPDPRVKATARAPGQLTLAFLTPPPRTTGMPPYGPTGDATASRLAPTETV
jgi:hypothetical protein